MVRTCLSRSFNASFLSSLVAVGFSLLITVDAHPVVAADGDLDTTFGTGGKVVTTAFSGSGRLRSLAQLPFSPTVRLWWRATLKMVRQQPMYSHSRATTRMAP